MEPKGLLEALTCLIKFALETETIAEAFVEDGEMDVVVGEEG
jgi:hypothetical protein